MQNRAQDNSTLMKQGQQVKKKIFYKYKTPIKNHKRGYCTQCSMAV